jgi:hypothetical protein
MDIGVPLRDLGKVEIGPLAERVWALDESEWTRNTLRQDALAFGAHSATQSILLKHEWNLEASTAGLGHLEDIIWSWAKGQGLDPHPFLPIARQETDVAPIFTLPDYLRFKDVVEPLVEQCIQGLGRPGGIVTRLALVRLPGGARIKPHFDGHKMAAKAHRLHVALGAAPSVVYKIGGRKYTMDAGHVYDFNNCLPHSVRNEGRKPRVNLFIDYYANPGPVVLNPLADLPPIFAPRTPRIN